MRALLLWQAESISPKGPLRAVAAFHLFSSPVIRGSALGSDPDACGGSFHGRGFPRFLCDLPFVGPF